MILFPKTNLSYLFTKEQDKNFNPYHSINDCVKMFLIIFGAYNIFYPLTVI